MRASRKSDLRRLAAKRGWNDGKSRNAPNPPAKMVMLPNGSVGYRHTPPDEEDAYWKGYREGLDACSSERNPYGVYHADN